MKWNTITKQIQSYGLPVVLLYSTVLRLIVFVVYDGITYFPDSGDYIELANLILKGEVIGYHGARTPGYSLFLALLGNNHFLVIMVQNLLGLLSLFMIYDLCKRLISNKISLIVSLLVASYLPFIFYDFAILSEGLSAYLMITLIWYLNRISFFNSNPKKRIYITVGLLCAALFLVRPFFIYLPFLLLGVLVVANFKKENQLWLYKSMILIIPIIAFLGWNSFNKYNTGVFMTSSYEGINITQVGTSFYEKLPDEYKIEREILVSTRKEVEATKPNHAYPMTIWFAREELKEATGLSDLGLSLRIKKMSKNLLLDNPLDYGNQAVISFTKFFGAENTLLWNVDKFNTTIVRKGLVGLWIYIQQYLLILLNIIFLVIGAKFFYKNRKFKTWELAHFVFLMVVLGALFQAAITFGNNSRFCYPFTVLMLVYSVNWLFPKLKNTP